jgi:DNA-binding transcriptional LysR family regulator
VTVAREGSFTRAAAQLGVSQSALSQTIRALEERLGLRLLTRTTRRVAPTDAGERLLSTIGPRLDGIEVDLAALGDLRDKPAGTIRITGFGTCSQFDPAAEVDAAIIRLSRHQARDQHRLPDDRLPWDFKKGSRELNVRVEGPLVLNGFPQVVQAALAGMGLAFVLEDVVEPYLADGRLVRVLDDWCSAFSGYHLYYPSRRQPSPAFSLIVDTLRYRH